VVSVLQLSTPNTCIRLSCPPIRATRPAHLILCVISGFRLGVNEIWDFTQLRTVVSSHRFGTTSRSHLTKCHVYPYRAGPFLFDFITPIIYVLDTKCVFFILFLLQCLSKASVAPVSKLSKVSDCILKVTRSYPHQNTECSGHRCRFLQHRQGNES
jgi:hypothetical protein